MKNLLSVIAFAFFFVGITGGKAMAEMTITSPAFSHMGMIPARFTCDGADVNPPLVVENIPEGTKTLALIVDDPDAPVGTWVHWVMWNIPANVTAIEENSVPEGAVQGRNDWGKNEYGGPCPPSGTHRYFFKLYALDTELDLPEGSTKKALEDAMSGHLLGKAELIGLYRRR